MRYLIVLGIVFLVVFIPAAITLYIKSKQEKAKPKPKDEEKKIELLGLFDWIRKYAAVPILYAILVGFLWYIEWTREIIKQNFGLVLIAVIAMALTPLLLEYKQKLEERVKSQKLVNSIYSLLVISVIGLVLALNFGWISKKTPEVKIAQAINESQMELELKPVFKRIAEIEKKAEKEMLSESEKSEMTNLLTEAERIRKKYELEKPLPKTTQQAPAVAQVAQQLPICAGGEYDFSNVELPNEVEVNFHPDCIVKVTLPPRVVYRTDLDQNAEIVFIDGSRYISGPKSSNWYGLKRGVFKVRGLSGAGIMKITFERKS